MGLWIFPILTRLRSTCTAPAGKGWSLMVVLVITVTDQAEEPVDCNVTIQLCWFRGLCCWGSSKLQNCAIKSLSVYLRSLVSAGRLVFSCCSHDYPGLLFLGFSKVNYSQCLTYVLLTSILFLSLSIAISLFLPIILDNWELSLTFTAISPGLNPNPENSEC